MRLIHVPTLKLEEFFEFDVPPYACLSHRWTREEVTLREFQNLDDPVIQAKQGYHKILGTCKQAEDQGIEYIWVDTCCIDKTSSAELSEAINSIWTWYRNCAVCFVYLSDVVGEQYGGSDGWDNHFESSAWFTRAWTLQELLAPDRVEVYDATWSFLGDRHTLKAQISGATGIALDALAAFEPNAWSVAQKMSWAAGRQASRREDIAYSLLGIFDVNMSLLYGEGSKAFMRLQEEIIRRTADKSIFTWEPVNNEVRGGRLFAESPDEFRDCARVVSSVELALNNKLFDDGIDYMKWLSVWTLNNLGLEMDLLLAPWTRDTYVAWLAKQMTETEEIHCFMLVRRLRASVHTIMERVDDDLLRANAAALQSYQFRYERRKVLVVRNRYSKIPASLLYDPRSAFKIFNPEVGKHKEWHIIPAPAATLSSLTLYMGKASKSIGTAGVLVKPWSAKETVIVKLGFDFNFDPMCEVSIESIKFDEIKHHLNVHSFSNFWTQACYDWRKTLRQFEHSTPGLPKPSHTLKPLRPHPMKLFLDYLDWNMYISEDPQAGVWIVKLVALVPPGVQPEKRLVMVA